MDQTKIKQFSNDLRAAILVDSPIFNPTEINLKHQLELNDTVEEHLLNQWLANQQRLESEQPNAEKNDKPNQGQPAQFLSVRYQAAVRALDFLHETPPLLDSLSVKHLAKADIKQVTRQPMHYLCLILAASLASLAIFKIKVLPAVDNLRADIALANRETPPARFDSSTPQDILLFGISMVTILFIGWLIFGGIQKLTMRIGGAQYINFRTSATVVEMTRLLIQGNLEAAKAASLSMDLSGLDHSFRNELNKSLASATDDKNLASTNAYYATAAALKFDNLANERTRVTVIGIGGFIAATSILSYCVPPLFAVAQDLMKASY
ncbi:hypothetical protein N9068_00245 [bacterium]|nr:hypothetical protein [bacterium]